MKKRKIGFLALLGFLAVSAVSVTTYAWFTQSGKADDVTFTAGKVSYSVTKLTENNNPVVPGVDFLNNQTLTFTNASTIDTQLRVKISYTIETKDKVEDKKITGDTFESSETADILWTKGTSSSKWVYDTTDKCYYYGSKTEDTGKIASTLTSIPFFETGDTLMLNGNKIGNDYQEATITIHFTFEAKQYEALTWADCADNTFDFETGLKKSN